ncbi:MAG: GyrI-like domain-containing protein [Bacteroidales bacterium]|nr:GyrI-like domain-containing protein [Bacteroidales bacterium]
MMTPQIEKLKSTKLIGIRTSMSFTDNKTVELWKAFAPRIKEIASAANPLLYSVEIYPTTEFYTKFDPAKTFEKWAAIEVHDFDNIPKGMEKLIIPEGLYAIFHYKGMASNAEELFRYIYSKWLPNSEYEMDNRPFLAVMGEKYKGEDPESEENFLVAVRKKVQP